MATDRDSTFDGNQITDRSIKQLELDLTNTPTDGQIVKINMPTGDFTAIDFATVSGSTFKQTFVDADLTADKITITHNLTIAHPVVVVYDNNENVILPSEITYVTDNSIELDFTGLTPLTGTYKVRVLGSTGTTGAFNQTFVDADLTAGILTASHNLSTKYVLVRIYDNLDNIIEADEYTATDTNTLTVDLTTFGTLTGSWNIIISTGGAGSGSGDSIQDADNDTKIEVEQSTDEDKIRFTTANTQRALMDANGLALESGADVNEFSVDGTLAGDSDDAVPTEKAVKTYADTKAGSFTQSFTNATLSTGILTVTHNLGKQYVDVIIYNNSNLKIMPDDITATSTTVITIDLTSFGTISGTWNIRVVG